MSSTAVIFGPVAIAIFTWEHVGRKKQTRVRPSIMISKVTSLSAQMFDRIGKVAAQISSFYAKIDPKVLVRFAKDLGQTANDLLAPTIQLMTTPINMIRSYYQTARTYGYPLLVGLGSATVLIAGFLVYTHVPEIGNKMEVLFGRVSTVKNMFLHRV